MTSQKGNTGVDSKKQQRLKTVLLGALAKMVAGLVVNILQPAAKQERGGKTGKASEGKTGTLRLQCIRVQIKWSV